MNFEKLNLVDFVIQTHNGKKLSIFVPIDSIVKGCQILKETQNFLPLRVYSTSFICCFTGMTDVTVDVIFNVTQFCGVKILVYHTESGYKTITGRLETSLEHCLYNAGQPR